MSLRLIILTLAVFVSETTLAETENRPIPYKIGLVEYYTPTVKVSGQLVVGIQVPTDSPVSLGNTLYIDKPEHINDFQLRIATIDGVYSARTPLKFEGAISGWYPINLQTKYQDALKNYAPYEIQAYLYKIIKNEQTKRSTHLIFPTSWGKPSGKPPKFYINSTGQVPQYVFKAGDQTKRIFCQEIKSNIRTAFTHECLWNEQLNSGENLVLFKSGSGRNKSYLIWGAAQ